VVCGDSETKRLSCTMQVLIIHLKRTMPKGWAKGRRGRPGADDTSQQKLDRSAILC
jgi:hypothetical protein